LLTISKACIAAFAFLSSEFSSKLCLTLSSQEGYDHSYFFISSFVDDHINHHAKALGVL